MDNTSNEIKKLNRSKIARYVQENKSVSRMDIAKNLGYSMPTVLSNVTELIEMGLVCEAGEYGSTGGRKPKTLAISKKFRYVVGLDITKRHLRLLLMDICGDILAEQYHCCIYEDTNDYYWQIGAYLETFLDENLEGRDKLIGVGISIPGIILPERDLLGRSHVLGVENVSLKRFRQHIPYPVLFDNDANCAAYVEVEHKDCTAYFSLCNTVGGAIYHGGKPWAGENNKSGEFGHMVIHPGGRRCYCGKNGCLDAYCAAWVLQGSQEAKLEDFFEALDSGDSKNQIKWRDYLENLAIAVSNIRMALDCRIVMGGYIGSFLEKHMDTFVEYIRRYDYFDADISYLSTGKYMRLASVVGVAQMVVHRYLDELYTA